MDKINALTDDQKRCALKFIETTEDIGEFSLPPEMVNELVQAGMIEEDGDLFYATDTLMRGRSDLERYVATIREPDLKQSQS